MPYSRRGKALGALQPHKETIQEITLDTMATIKREIEFRCDNDCKQSGCPSHKGVFTFQTTATVFCWSVDGKETWFDYNQLEAFTNILKEVSTFRVDMPSIK